MDTQEVSDCQVKCDTIDLFEMEEEEEDFIPPSLEEFPQLTNPYSPLEVRAHPVARGPCLFAWRLWDQRSEGAKEKRVYEMNFVTGDME